MLEQPITLIYENINQGPIMAFKKKAASLIVYDRDEINGNVKVSVEKTR